jgi:carbon storage regulator
MLVLTRKTDERILVGSDIVITVVRVSGNRVCLGIEAPAGVRILREELTPIDSQEKTPLSTMRRAARGRAKELQPSATRVALAEQSRRTVAEIMGEAMHRLASRAQVETTEPRPGRHSGGTIETSHPRASA